MKELRALVFVVFIFALFSFANISVKGEMFASPSITYDNLTGPYSKDPYKDILEISRAYGKLFGVDGCSLAKSMSGVFHVETGGRQNIHRKGSSFAGSFQQGVPFVIDSLKVLGGDLVKMSALVDKGEINREVYRHMLSATRQGQILGPSKGRFHHMYSTIIALAQHARIEKALQSTTNNQLIRASVHQLFQFAPPKVGRAINSGTANFTRAKWHNNCGLTNETIAQAAIKLANNSCGKRLIQGINKINCETPAGYDIQSGFGEVTISDSDLTSSLPSSELNLQQLQDFGSSGDMRDYAPTVPPNVDEQNLPKDFLERPWWEQGENNLNLDNEQNNNLFDGSSSSSELFDLTPESNPESDNFDLDTWNADDTNWYDYSSQEDAYTDTNQEYVNDPVGDQQENTYTNQEYIDGSEDSSQEDTETPEDYTNFENEQNSNGTVANYFSPLVSVGRWVSNFVSHTNTNVNKNENEDEQDSRVPTETESMHELLTGIFTGEDSGDQNRQILTPDAKQEIYLPGFEKDKGFITKQELEQARKLFEQEQQNDMPLPGDSFVQNKGNVQTDNEPEVANEPWWRRLLSGIYNLLFFWR